MGQYHYLVNLTKKQFVYPHEIGNGLKLREQVGWDCSTSTALVMLLAASNGRGGGDFQTQCPLIGSWAGDRIAFIGDYAEADDVPGNDAPKIFKDIAGDSPRRGWANISARVRDMMASEFNVHYKGSGWLDIEKGPAPKKGWVEANPLVVFDYPDSKNYGSPRRREVRVIEANEDYVIGLDTLDKNRFKKFKRSRIQGWRSREILEFKS